MKKKSNFIIGLIAATLTFGGLAYMSGHRQHHFHNSHQSHCETFRDGSHWNHHENTKHTNDKLQDNNNQNR